MGKKISKTKQETEEENDHSNRKLKQAHMRNRKNWIAVMPW